MVNHTVCSKAQRSLELKFVRAELESLESLREAAQRECEIAQLSQASGIDDVQALGQLCRAGFNAQNVLALEWFPIAMVAWASDGVDANEIQAVSLTALYAQASRQAEAPHLLEHWLKQKPPEAYWELWNLYVHARSQRMSTDDFRLSGQLILAIAERVARASGGFMGIQSISASERQVLRRISDAYGLDNWA